VYRGNDLHNAFLTLEQQQVYSGSDTGEPLLYRFSDSEVLAGSGDGCSDKPGPDSVEPLLGTFSSILSVLYRTLFRMRAPIAYMSF